jgi:hypothetical protein
MLLLQTLLPVMTLLPEKVMQMPSLLRQALLPVMMLLLL